MTSSKYESGGILLVYWNFGFDPGIIGNFGGILKKFIAIEWNLLECKTDLPQHQIIVSSKEQSFCNRLFLERAGKIPSPPPFTDVFHNITFETFTQITIYVLQKQIVGRNLQIVPQLGALVENP